MKSAFLIFFFVLCSFTLPIFPQEKPVAVKIDEHNDEIETIDLFVEKTKTFLRKVSEAPKTTRGFIFVTTREHSTYKRLSEKLKQILSENSELKHRITLSQAGVRYITQPQITEFWLIPKGTEEPYIPFSISYVCPSIKIVGNENFSDFSQPLVFSASISGGSQSDVEYKWTISAGKILQGQGTPTIEIDLSKEFTKNLKISVEINEIDKFGEMNELCKTKVEFETKYAGKP